MSNDNVRVYRISGPALTVNGFMEGHDDIIVLNNDNHILRFKYEPGPVLRLVGTDAHGILEARAKGFLFRAEKTHELFEVGSEFLLPARGYKNSIRWTAFSAVARYVLPEKDFVYMAQENKLAWEGYNMELGYINSRFNPRVQTGDPQALYDLLHQLEATERQAGAEAYRQGKPQIPDNKRKDPIGITGIIQSLDAEFSVGWSLAKKRSELVAPKSLKERLREYSANNS